MKNTKSIKRTSKVRGTDDRPRLSVYRSNKNLVAQILNDEKGITLLGMSTKKIIKKGVKKTEAAKTLGLELAKKAIDKKIKKIVFDRGSYRYLGRIKILAEALREGGLDF